MFDDRFVLQHRGPKNLVDPRRAYATAWEEEPDASGALVPTAVVFLTNRECPFRCVMCDLWMNTLDDAVPRGAIAHQIRGALSELPPARHIKLYNAGSFFDPQQIPADDDEEIAATVEGFDRVIVESHPAFLSGAYGERCRRFQASIPGRLEVADRSGDCASRRARAAQQADDARGVSPRGRLPPPARHRAARVHAAQPAVRARPTRPSNGPADRSMSPPTAAPPRARSFRPAAATARWKRSATRSSPPRLPELEAVIEYGLRQRRAGPDRMRVFADLWDVERLFVRLLTGAGRPAAAMNREQRIVDPVVCACDSRH